MLPASFKFGIQNDSGAAAGLSVKVSPWKFETTGALEYGTPVTVATVGEEANIGASAETAPFDNTGAANLWLGAHLELSFSGVGTSGGVAYLVPNTATGQNLLLASVAAVENSLIIPAEL